MNAAARERVGGACLNVGGRCPITRLCALTPERARLASSVRPQACCGARATESWGGDDPGSAAEPCSVPGMGAEESARMEAFPRFNPNPVLELSPAGAIYVR